MHRKRAGSLSVRLVPEALGAGKPGTVFCSPGNTAGSRREGKFFRLPGALIRYTPDLSTRDGRRLDHIFDPDRLQNNLSPFDAPERGAYYGERDRLLIFDGLGLFRAAFAVPQAPGPRLLVMPAAAEQTVPLFVQSGGTEQRTEPQFLRTDNLIDHRPYVPGDDPRRINWKLYGHAGDLFVREGEPEPPPHSKLVILIDTQTDSALYTAETGRRGVDLLCENALALALDYSGRVMDVSIGYTGGGITGGGPGELAAVLAYPAALPFSVSLELPAADDARGVLVLALPRTGDSGAAALENFLKKRGAKQSVDLLFLYGEDSSRRGASLEENAETCARLYGGKGGVRARHIRL
jgi:hypothetical protein